MAYPQVKEPWKIRHPDYMSNQESWRKWRLASEGGDRFLRQYLKRFSKREGDLEFAERKAITYVPAFAKAGLNEVKNAIYQRMTDITRDGGSQTYQDACAGINWGVDKMGNTMNSFMARRIIPDLIAMQRVGIYVDMPPVNGPTKADSKGKRPYLCWYRTEDIFCWNVSCDRPGEYNNILLGDTALEDDYDSWLPSAEVRRFRHMWVDPDDGFVRCQFYDLGGDRWYPDNYGGVTNEPIKLNIRRIPFLMLELSESLMADIANYQIALLNMASSDVAHAVKSNFPVYVEQFDPKTESPHIRQEAPNQYFQQSTGYQPLGAQVIVVNQENENNIKLGTNSGRKYPLGTNQPAFINPSSEPLQASMAKQAQMKAEIRELINLAISNLAPGSNGVAEVGFDSQSVESGLAYIGLELEVAERKIAEYWAMYEGTDDIARIFYPENYSLTSEEERIEAATEYLDLMPKLPSQTYQKEMAKQAVKKLLENKVSMTTLKKMYAEIDAAPVISTDPEVIKGDFESGLVGLETASKARGYPPGEVEKAKKDHADRVATIAIAQSEGGGAGASAKNPQARGVKDMSGNKKGATEEKKASLDTSGDHTVTDKQRGTGK